MEQNQTPETKTNPILKTSRTTAGILFLLLVLGVLFYTKRDFFVPQKTGSPENLKVAQTSMEVTTLTRQTVLVFPEVLSYREVSPQGLPQFVQELVRSANGSLTISRAVAYADGRSGYRLHLDAPLPLIKSYQAILAYFKQSGWKSLVGRRTALASLIESENNQYYARILQTAQSESETLVVVQLISK